MGAVIESVFGLDNDSGPSVKDLERERAEDEAAKAETLKEEAVKRNRRSTRERLKNPGLFIPGVG